MKDENMKDENTKDENIKDNNIIFDTHGILVGITDLRSVTVPDSVNNSLNIDVDGSFVFDNRGYYTGWVCPLCDTVYSPWTEKCTDTECVSNAKKKNLGEPNGNV